MVLQCKLVGFIGLRDLGYRHSWCEAHEACVGQILNSVVVATPVWCLVEWTAEG